MKKVSIDIELYAFLLAMSACAVLLTIVLFLNLRVGGECPEGYTCEKIVNNVTCYERLEVTYGVPIMGEVAFNTKLVYENGTEIPRCEK